MPGHYILLINRGWGHYREISDRGLDVLTSLSLGQYIKAEVWDFPVMTERTRLISCLLYGLFSAILKKNTIKTLIFHIRLRALRLSSSLILKKYLYASFSFSHWKYSCTLSIFSVVFAHANVVLLTTQKSCWTEKKFHNARSLQENNAHSANTIFLCFI